MFTSKPIPNVSVITELTFQLGYHNIDGMYIESEIEVQVMKRWSVDLLQAGMVLGRSVHYDGKVMLNKGTKLTDNYIERLRQLGFRTVYVDDLQVNHEVMELVGEKTRLETFKAVKTSYASLQKKLNLNLQAISKCVDYIIDEVLANHNVLVNLADIRSHDDYLFSHGVNVCILSLATGITLAYHDLMLKDLGVGALLHDVGMVGIDPQIINKPSDLNNKEIQIIKQHPWRGFKTLRDLSDISLLSAHIALQHHERWNGGGYPRNLQKENIHEYARIVSIADTFDALVSDHPYRYGYSFDQSLTVLSRLSETCFDPEILKAFGTKISVFPIGTIITLNTGETGIVVDVHRDYPSQPVVRILADRHHNPLPKYHEIDLSRMKTVYITGIQEKYEELQNA